MKNFIKQVNEALSPYYSLLTMLFFFTTTVITASKWLSSSNDLDVMVSYERVSLPSHIQKSCEAMFNYVLNTVDNRSIQNDANTLYKYLIDTQEKKKIEVRNNTNEIISDIILRDCSVSELTSWGVSTTMKVSRESNEILKNVQHDKKANILTISEPISLMPGERLYLTIWGSFTHGREQDKLFINYKNKLAHISVSKEFTGTAAVFAEYYIPFLILIFIFIVVGGYYIIQYDQSVKKEDISNNCQ